MKLGFSKRKSTWWQLMLVSIVCNAVLFLIIRQIYPAVFTTNDDYRMRLIVSGAYTGTPSSELVFMYRWIGVLLSSIYRISTALNWYGCFIIGTMFFPCCVMLYHMLERSGRRKVQAFLLYLLIFFLGFQKHLMMPQFTISAAFMFMAFLIFEIRLLTAENRKAKIINFIWMIVSGILSISIREKVFLMLLPGAFLLLLAHVFWERKTAEEWKRILCRLAAAAGVLLLLFGTQRLATGSKDYQDFAEFNVARSNVFDYDGVPDYDANQEFYDSIGVDKAAWKALAGRIFGVSDQINAETLKEIAHYSKQISDQTILDKLLNAVENAYTELMANLVRGQFLCVLLLLFLIVRVNGDVSDKRYSYLMFLIAAYQVTALILFGVLGRIMPRLVEALDLMADACAISILFELFRQKDSCEEGKWPQKITAIWQVVRYGGLGILAVSMLTYNFLYLDQDGAYKTLIQSAGCLDSLEQYAKKDEKMYIFYNALDFIGCSDWVFDGEDGRFSQIDSLGNWNSESDTWKQRNELLGGETVMDVLVENPDVYYAEIGGYHAEIGDLLEQRGKKLEWFDSYQAGSRTVTIYRVTEIDTEDKRK